jgi:hypothetical protein
MGDTSVRFIFNGVGLLPVWRPLSTIAGGETIPDF